jgi:GMP synthase-like glutamine amidotransferase
LAGLSPGADIVTSPRLLVIDPSVSFPEDKGTERLIRGWPGEVQVLRPVLQPGDGPTAGLAYDFSAVVVLGSRASALDEFSWLADLAAWLRPIIRGDVEVPLLGICFGHQLIAHLAGGEIGFVRDDRSKLLGVADTRLESCRLLPYCSLRVVISHAEEVKSLPAGFHKASDRSPVLFDGLEHDRLPIFSFQFHPEAGVDFLAKRGVQVTALDAVKLDEDSERLLGAFRTLALSRPR